MAKISKKGLAVTFDTSGYTQFASNMMLQNAQQEVKYIQDFVQNQRELRKTLSDNYSVAPNGVHGLGLEHFDKVASTLYTQAMNKAMSGPITNQDIAEFTSRLSQEKQAINSGIAMEAELIKQAPKDMDARRLQGVLASWRDNAYKSGTPQDYVNMLDGINITELDGSSYLLDENTAGKSWIDTYGETKRSTYGDTSQVTTSLSNVFDQTTRRVRKGADGLIADEIYQNASSDASMSRIMDDEVLKVAYIKANGSLDGYDEVREGMLVSGQVPKSIADNVASIGPRERETIRKNALERVILNVANNTYQITPLSASQAKGRLDISGRGVGIRKGAGGSLETSTLIGGLRNPFDANKEARIQTYSASPKYLATANVQGSAANIAIKGYAFAPVAGAGSRLVITGDRLVGLTQDDYTRQMALQNQSVLTPQEQQELSALKSKVKQEVVGGLIVPENPEIVASEILKSITQGIQYSYPENVDTDYDKLLYIYEQSTSQAPQSKEKKQSSSSSSNPSGTERFRPNTTN